MGRTGGGSGITDIDTLAELNAIFTDGTVLDTDSAARPPDSHAIDGADHSGEGDLVTKNEAALSLTVSQISDAGDSATKDVGTGAGDVAAGNKGVTNGDSHDHDGGDGASVPIGGLKTATTGTIAGGKLAHDSTGFIQGFNEAFDQSRSGAQLATDGYTVNAESGTVSEGASALTTSIGAGVGCDWFNGTYDAPRLTRAVPTGDWLARAPYDMQQPATNDNGCTMIFRGDADASFVRVSHVYTAGGHLTQMHHGPNTQMHSSAFGTGTGWLGIAKIGGRFIGLHSNNAAGSTPGDGDWTIMDEDDVEDMMSSAKVWQGTVSLGVVSFSSKPASDIEWGRLDIVAL